MMVEVFKYTERVVNMARPRKVLMMAIGKLYSLAASGSSTKDRSRLSRRCGASSQDEPAAIAKIQGCTGGGRQRREQIRGRQDV